MAGKSINCHTNATDVAHEVEAGFNPIAFRKAKIAYNFGLSECNRVEAPLS